MNEYKLESFQRVQPPENSSKKLWYEYILSNKMNKITGCRAGSYHSVLEFVNACITNLNQNYIPNESKAFKPVNETNGIIELGNIRTDW